jgi:hypothetical protein
MKHRELLKKERFLDKTYGKMYAHQGYIGNSLMEMLFIDGVQLISPIRNNMKNSLMTMSYKMLLGKRSVIETVNDELKNIGQIQHSRQKSFGNFLVNIKTGLIAYRILPKN